MHAWALLVNLPTHHHRIRSEEGGGVAWALLRQLANAHIAGTWRVAHWKQRGCGMAGDGCVSLLPELVKDLPATFTSSPPPRSAGPFLCHCLSSSTVQRASLPSLPLQSQSQAALTNLTTAQGMYVYSLHQTRRVSRARNQLGPD